MLQIWRRCDVYIGCDAYNRMNSSSAPSRTNDSLPVEDWPCLTQVAKVWWKFLFCWNVTVAGDPTLVVSTTLVPVGTGPVREPTTTFCGVETVVAVLLAVVAAGTTPPAGSCFCCSRRFYSEKKWNKEIISIFRIYDIKIVSTQYWEIKACGGILVQIVEDWRIGSLTSRTTNLLRMYSQKFSFIATLKSLAYVNFTAHFTLKKPAQHIYLSETNQKD